MNMGMGYDPRSIANALLDIAQEAGIELTNLTLNKIIYFVHTDCMLQKAERLSSLTFEAWQYGPVLPIIYHQFKEHNRRPITNRATKLDPESGQRLVVEYHDLSDKLPFIKERFFEYAKLSASALVELSHEPGGAWHKVWNGTVDSIGMKITDDLILGYNRKSINNGTDSYGPLH